MEIIIKNFSYEDGNLREKNQITSFEEFESLIDELLFLKKKWITSIEIHNIENHFKIVKLLSDVCLKYGLIFPNLKFNFCINDEIKEFLINFKNSVDYKIDIKHLNILTYRNI